MDKLHREHEMILDVWKFMKRCEEENKPTTEFWQWAVDSAETLAMKYTTFTFINDWMASYLKYLDNYKRDNNGQI